MARTYKKRIPLTKDVLTEHVRNSTTITAVAQKLGYTRKDGNTITYVGSRIRHFGLDTSHFLPFTHALGKSRGWNKKSVAEILIHRAGSGRRQDTALLRRALIESGRVHQCYRCESTHWQGEKLVLHIDHIDGDYENDTEDNLRFACPNCHSLTPTYGKTKDRLVKELRREEKRRKVRVYKAAKLSGLSSPVFNCVKHTRRYSTGACRDCAREKNPSAQKIEWPDVATLEKKVSETSMWAVGMELGVSDNAVRKHIRKHKML